MSRLTVLTEEVGGMIRQWTLSSALSHLRVFVASLSGAEHQAAVRAWVVTTDQGRERRQARALRQTPPAEAPPAPAQPQQQAAQETEEAMEVVSAEAEAGQGGQEVPPAEQEAVFPAALLSAVATPTSPLSSLPPAWLPIISRDQAQAPGTRSMSWHVSGLLFNRLLPAGRRPTAMLTSAGSRASGGS